MTQSRVLPVVAGLLVAGCAVVWALAWRGAGRPDPAPKVSTAPAKPPQPQVSYDEWAREEFLRQHPGEKPLNWRIAEKAEEFRRVRPMGRFVLEVNDCSDFTDCVLDDALGAKARFRRDSDRHILSGEPSLWEFYRWAPTSTLMPGDEIAVRHSPHYPPSDEAPWHRGILGTDGMVYDWTKLKSWSTDRYGRYPVDWFLHYSHGRNEIIIRRLRAKYRYRIEPIPLHGVPAPKLPPSPRTAS